MKQVLIASLISIFSMLGGIAQTSHTGIRGITAMEVTGEMAPGLNLFNTLDADCGSQGLASETCWGNPYTTHEMIDSMASRGFKTLRIPVTWNNHTGPAPDYIIDTTWMDRVEEVANYAFDNNMYVIINIHHDDHQIVPTYAEQEESTKRLEKVWAQIATRFKDYGDYLLFETLNEPREVGSDEEWTGGSAEHRDVVNAFNLAAVNIIRASGGNNEYRFIMIPQVGANPTAAKEDLIIPNADTNIIVSLHNYGPWDFCLNGDGTARWGSASEIKALQNDIGSYYDHFIKEGIPAILGEWGAGNKDNYGDRVLYYDVFANACKDNGVTPIVWIYEFNRRTLTWNYPLLEGAILQAYDSTAIDVEEIQLNITSDTLYFGDTLQLVATVLPDTATSQGVAWTSYNSIIASVDSSGLVIAKGGGNVTISATAIGKSIKCNLHVIDTLIHTEFLIQAEDYSSQSGTQTESCSDDGGGQNIGYIENGDWCSYSIKIDSAGVYDISARVATDASGGTIEIEANSKVEGTLAVDASLSNGWQDWYTTDAVEIGLPEGQITLKSTFKGGGGSLFNVNWYELSYKGPSDNTAVLSNMANTSDIKVYPNPVSELLNIEMSDKTSRVEIYALDGRQVYQKNTNAKQLQIDVSIYDPGNYILRVVSIDNQVSKKIVIQ